MMLLVLLLLEMVYGKKVKVASNICMSVDKRRKQITDPSLYARITFRQGLYVRGMTLVYKSGALNCYAGGRWSHWSCDIGPLRRLDVLAMFITDSSKSIKYPTPRTKNWRGWDTHYAGTKTTWYKWARKPGQNVPNRDLPELEFEGPNYWIPRGQTWRVYYGETLFNRAAGDNRGHVCFDVIADVGSPCEPNPCLANYKCSDSGRGRYACNKITPCQPNPCPANSKCLDNGKGGHTCKKIDPCQPNPCPANNKCLDNGKGGHTCKKIDPCQPNPCPANSKCLDNGKGGHTCKKIDPCKSNSCPGGTKCQANSSGGYNCLPVDPCNPNPCPANTKCMNNGNGKHTCKKIDPCQPNPCPTNSKCLDNGKGGHTCKKIDPCKSNSCPGGTKCQANSSGGYNCLPVDPCNPNPCPANTKCMNNGNGKHTCKKIDPCQPNPCPANTKCMNNGSGGHTCKKVNKCLSSKPCKADEECEPTMTVPGFKCKKSNEEMKFKGKGCCRFAKAIAKDWEYEEIHTEAGCLAQCQKDISCVAADIEFENGEAICSTFKGDVNESFQLQDCGNRDAHKCFVKHSRIKEIGALEEAGKGCCRWKQGNWSGNTQLLRPSTSAACKASCKKDPKCLACDFVGTQCYRFYQPPASKPQLKDFYVDTNCKGATCWVKSTGTLLAEETAWELIQYHVQYHPATVGACLAAGVAVMATLLTYRARKRSAEQMYQRLANEDNI